MNTCIQPITARSPRRVACLAAAAVCLVAGSAVAAEVPQKPVPGRPVPLPSLPRAHRVESSYQTWLGFTAKGPLLKPVVVFIDLVSGFRDDMHLANLTVRPALGLRLPLGFSVHAGYSYSSLWNKEREHDEEHAAFQQIAYEAPIKAVGLQVRVRGEERFRARSDVGYRLRGLAQLDVPFGRRSPLHLVLWNEGFLGLNQPADWQPELWDQNLFFAGLGWVPSRRFQAEIGYMGAFVPRRDKTSLIHCLSIGTTASW